MSETPSSTSAAEEGTRSGPTVRDKRRIDPDTYQVREPQFAAAPAQPAASGEAADGPDAEAAESASAAGEAELLEVQAALAERTADLQRLQAEYINYKRRVDRDRDLSRTNTIAGVLNEFLPVLDNLKSAREHEELTGGFKAVADEIERVTGKYGLVSYGEKGDPFDPHIHDALMHAHADGVSGPTCVEILQPGYKINERVLRPARVAVAEPAEDTPAVAADDSAPSDDLPGEPAPGEIGPEETS